MTITFEPGELVGSYLGGTAPILAYIESGGWGVGWGDPCVCVCVGGGGAWVVWVSVALQPALLLRGALGVGMCAVVVHGASLGQLCRCKEPRDA
jgi:hypothetical protein